jgi:hypothetical protein
MSRELEEARDEIRFLRTLVDQLVMEGGTSWKVVQLRVKRYESPLERTSWRLSYLMALEEGGGVRKEAGRRAETTAAYVRHPPRARQ